MNTISEQSAIEIFKDLCRKEFSYLLKEFSFYEVDIPLQEFENKFKIRFARHDFTVIVEGIHYGSAVMVYLQDSKGRKISPRLLDPNYQPLLKKRKKKITSQAEEITEDAKLLYQYGLELLRGNYSFFNKAIEKELTAWSEYESRSAFGIAEQEAIEAYKKQDWVKVIKLLEPYKDKLSKRMLRKFSEAQDKLNSHENK